MINWILFHLIEAPDGIIYLREDKILSISSIPNGGTRIFFTKEEMYITRPFEIEVTGDCRSLALQFEMNKP